jgi:hypothetical protein
MIAPPNCANSNRKVRKEKKRCENPGQGFRALAMRSYYPYVHGGQCMVVSGWWSSNPMCQSTKPCTHIAVVNKTILHHHVIKRQGRARGDSEEPALLRGVQHGAVAVDRDVRAGRDGNLGTVVAGEVGCERNRDRSAARNGLANAGPGARGRVAPAAWASSDLGLACARTKSVAEYLSLSMAAHKLPVAAEEKAANANGTVTQPNLIGVLCHQPTHK